MQPYITPLLSLLPLLLLAQAAAIPQVRPGRETEEYLREAGRGVAFIRPVTHFFFLKLETFFFFWPTVRAFVVGFQGFVMFCGGFRGSHVVFGCLGVCFFRGGQKLPYKSTKTHPKFLCPKSYAKIPSKQTLRSLPNKGSAAKLGAWTQKHQNGWRKWTKGLAVP